MGQYYKKVLTKYASPIAIGLGLNHIARPFYAGRGHILMFHRVIPEKTANRIHNHLSLEINPEHLEEIIRFFKKRNYVFISLDDLKSWLSQNKKTKFKFVIFTFDDGYKDNLNYAYPILVKHQVPFTIYVSTIFPDKKAILWWYILEEIIRNNEKVEYNFSSCQGKLNTINYRNKEEAFYKLRSIIIKMNEFNLSDELTNFFRLYEYDLYDLNDKLTLSWENITELSSDKFVTIGSHTINHYNLVNLSKEKLITEIQDSKNIIELKTNKVVNHFCYPLGQFDQREVEFVRDNMYLTATTTKVANIFQDHLENLYTLPRIPINSLTNEKVLSLQISGFYQAILNRLKRVVN